MLSYYAPYVSGLTENARLVAEAMVALGFEVTVLAGRHGRNLPSREVIRGVQVLRAEPLFFLHKGYISYRLPLLFRQAASRADVVHLHLPMLEAALLARLTPSGVPLLVTYHCDVDFSRHRGLVDRLAVGAVRRSARSCLRRANHIAVSSFDYARGSEVLKGFEDKWIEVHPPDKGPVANSRLGPVEARPKKRVGFLGRFAEEKGIKVLLDAIPGVVQRVPNVQFVLAGEHQAIAGGSQMDLLRNKIEDLGAYVEVPGWIPESALPAFYQSLDLFVLPSINSYEAFGIVQVEAMKAGVPVVASDRPGMRVPILRTGNGMLAKTGDSSDLAAKIVAALHQYGPENREHVARLAWGAFSNDEAFAKIQRIYSDLCERRGPKMKEGGE